MTSLVNFQPTALSAFQFSATLDGQLYSVLVSWNLSGQRWYINIHDGDQNLILCRSVVGSPTPRNLSPPPSAEEVSSMTWTNDDGGRVYFVMAEPSLTVRRGSYVNVSGAVNSGTGGDGAVNGTFLIDQFTDPSNFAALLTAPAGVIGTISGDIVINAQANSLVWKRGVVIATTETPHKYPLGSVVKLSVDNAVPTGYNGTYYCAISGPREFRFQLTADPGGPSTAPGSYSPDLNLVDSYFDFSSLVYRTDAQRFEIRP